MELAEGEAASKAATRLASRRLWWGAAALLIAGLAAAWHLSDWTVRLRYPGEESLIEGIQLAEMVQLRQRRPIYARPAQGRFDTANYGPIFYLLGATLADPERPSPLPMRIVSLAGALGCAAGAALLAYRLAGSALAAALAPLMFLALGFVTRYATTIRCDFPALLLIFAGVLVAHRWRASRGLLASIPLLVLGLFLKQQFVAAPLAILLFLVLERRYRMAAAFGAIVAVSSAALLALFQFVVFRGQDFWTHITVFNLLPPSGKRFIVEGQFFLIVMVLPLILGIELLRRRPDRLLACYLGCAVVLSLVSMGRVGSDTNYFLETAVILSALVSALLTLEITAAGRSQPVEVLVLLTVTLFAALFTANPAPGHDDFARDRAIQKYLRETFPPHTPVLTYFTGDPLRAGLETPVTNLYHYVWLIRRGALPGADLTDAIRQHRYGAVALNFDLAREQDPNRRQLYLTPAMIQDILANYQLAASLDMPQPEKIHDQDRFYVWIPRPPGNDSQPEGVHDDPRPE